jgi:hypothetical protein
LFGWRFGFCERRSLKLGRDDISFTTKKSYFPIAIACWAMRLDVLTTVRFAS